MPLSIILKTELKSGRMTIARSSAGKVEYADVRSAENEASRMRFRDDAANYCVYSGLFDDLREATLYVQLRNQGLSTSQAWKRVKPNAHRSV